MTWTKLLQLNLQAGQNRAFIQAQVAHEVMSQLLIAIVLCWKFFLEILLLFWKLWLQKRSECESKQGYWAKRWTESHIAPRLPGCEWWKRAVKKKKSQLAKKCIICDSDVRCRAPRWGTSAALPPRPRQISLSLERRSASASQLLAPRRKN